MHYHMPLVATMCYPHKYEEHAYTLRGACLHMRGPKTTLKWPRAGRHSFSSNFLQATYAQTYAQHPNMNSISKAQGEWVLTCPRKGAILFDKLQHILNNFDETGVKED